MASKNLRLRFATVKDANKLLNIYAPFVKNADFSKSDVSFEYTVPGSVEFSERIKDISSKYPYLVLEEDDIIVGYAYAHPYIARAAYQWSAEATIYLGPAGQGKGYGRILYTALEKLLLLQGITNLYACITKSNEHSVKMHEAMGYKINGVFTKCGFKNGHWLDMVWMEKILQEHKSEPGLLKLIKDIDMNAVEQALRIE